MQLAASHTWSESEAPLEILRSIIHESRASCLVKLGLEWSSESPASWADRPDDTRPAAFQMHEDITGLEIPFWNFESWVK